MPSCSWNCGISAKRIQIFAFPCPLCALSILFRGGTSYKDKATVDLKLSSVSMAEVVRRAHADTSARFVVLKVPFNFDTNARLQQQEQARAQHAGAASKAQLPMNAKTKEIRLGKTTKLVIVELASRKREPGRRKTVARAEEKRKEQGSDEDEEVEEEELDLFKQRNLDALAAYDAQRRYRFAKNRAGGGTSATSETEHELIR